MPGVVERTTPPEEAPWTIDELVRSRAASDPNQPIVAYPTDGINYINYTFRQLDVYAYRAAQHYATVISTRKSSADPTKVIGLLAPSNIDYLITTIALSKLGFTVLFLSTRLSDAAYLNLFTLAGCTDLLIDPTLGQKSENLKAAAPSLNVQTVAGAPVYDFPLKDGDIETRIDYQFDHVTENTNIVWIIHSSGSTGLPKPIFQTHAAALRNYATSFNMRGYITLPLYHAHGLSSTFRSLHSKKQIHIYNASLPLTGPSLLDTISQNSFEIFYGVPYALKLLSETSQGLKELAKMKLVMFGGSSCPQELGDKLVNHGVKLVSHYGTLVTSSIALICQVVNYLQHGDRSINDFFSK